jgi:hypothetical protein
MFDNVFLQDHSMADMDEGFAVISEQCLDKFVIIKKFDATY